jgi:hypothetical protein
MQFERTAPKVTLEHFLRKAERVSHFTSSNGKRYKVVRLDNNIMTFQRLDAKKENEWDIDLRAVYQAYLELDNFDTVSFKPFVPRRHSPARGLLLHLGMLEPKR